MSLDTATADRLMSALATVVAIPVTPHDNPPRAEETP